jgi:hypothetical protein
MPDRRCGGTGPRPPLRIMILAVDDRSRLCQHPASDVASGYGSRVIVPVN